MIEYEMLRLYTKSILLSAIPRSFFADETLPFFSRIALLFTPLMLNFQVLL
jgi:hypothetical protein